MTQKLKLVEDAGGKGAAFFCPGCKDTHVIYYEGHPSRWTWNGDLDRPTFSPNIRVRTGHFIEGSSKNSCWCTYNREHPDDPSTFTCIHCHSYVIDGKIRFLDDCSHALVGQTVDLPPWPKDH
jgi:hypothetical protein